MPNKIKSSINARTSLVEAFPNITNIEVLDTSSIYRHRDDGLLKFLEHIQKTPDYAEMRETVTTPEDLSASFYAFTQTFNTQYFIDKFNKITKHAEFVQWQLSLPTPYGDCEGYFTNQYTKYMFSDLKKLMSKENYVNVVHESVNMFREVLETRIKTPEVDVSQMRGREYKLGGVSVGVCVEMLKMMDEGYIPVSCLYMSIPMFNYMATTLKSFNDPVCEKVNRDLMQLYISNEIPKYGMYSGTRDLDSYSRIAVGLILKAVATIFKDDVGLPDSYCPNSMSVNVGEIIYTYNSDSVDRDGDLQLVFISLRKEYDPPKGRYDDETYVMVQTLNGAEPRGGITLPFLYKVSATGECAADTQQLRDVELHGIGPSCEFLDLYSSYAMLNVDMKVVYFNSRDGGRHSTLEDFVDAEDIITDLGEERRVLLESVDSATQNRLFVKVQDVIDSIIL